MSSSLIVSGLPIRIIQILFKNQSGAESGSGVVRLLSYVSTCKVNLNMISTVFLLRILLFK